MNRRPGFRFRARSGFTLIEIMVVVGILAMVLALGMPPFLRSLKKDPLRKAVSDITDACGDARAKAILLGVPTELVIRGGGELSVAAVPESEAGSSALSEEPAAQPAALSKSQLFSAHLQEDVAITLLYVNLKDQMQTEAAHVHFYPNGTSDEFTIVLQAQGGVRKISLECVTALATVEVIR